MSVEMFRIGEKVSIKKTKEQVIISKSQYVKNMKRYSYVVDKYPGTFFFEEELMKNEKN
ncbi:MULTISPECIES: hypothetical protein [Cytobacillus]|uniref:DUF2187 domain-containing protein n=1 Tax=Cytobacillus stercorigallinarum TaxID=2762240 RepID=A0ABR8QP21_9BACI|nr:hypothetical protein [Cytobacillus stercorigallinarum]MBD7937276.1 hypothetical protein [Cytobacillus stercorigallinarum]